MDARFISRSEEHFDCKGPYLPALYFRSEFEIKEIPISATLYMTSLGNYVPFVNGIKPDRQYLTPGYTQYTKRLQYQEYDVSLLISYGTNAIGAIVGDGWYRGSGGPTGMRATYGDRLALAAELVIKYEDHCVTFTTDASWKWTDKGPIREQDWKQIEHYDARAEMDGWNKAGFDDREWEKCEEISYEGQTVPSEGEIVCEHEHFAPNVIHTPDGSTVLDFGQNISGMVRFTVTGHVGQTVRLFHGEHIDREGNFTTEHLTAGKLLTLGQEVIYDLKEGTQTFSPFFQTCGFQYVKLVDWPEEVKAENFEAIALYSNMPFLGEFTCSNEKLNRLAKNMEWSLKSNFVDVPTDCPQRERGPWTGDINVTIECANYYADTRKFIGKWLKDIPLAQQADGSIPSLVPYVDLFGNHSEYDMSAGAAGWADAVTRVPFQQYLTYGDTKEIADCYEAMVRYVEYNVKRAKKNSVYSKLNPSKDNEYILECGHHYGEWLEPGHTNLQDIIITSLKTDAEVATAWFYYSAKTLSHCAELLGKKSDAEKYGILAENIRIAYIHRFIRDGKVKSKRQCRFVRPLYMGIIDGELKKTVAKQLNDLVISNEYKIGTGFCSTYQILNVLSDNGYHETACRMIENEQCPGWLYEVNCGATSIWEGWDAIDPKTGNIKKKSLNHYSPGAALSWLWSRLCGIKSLSPGYGSILLEPKPGGTITSAKAAYYSINGRIVSDWHVENGEFILNAEIPEGIDAVVILPDGTQITNAVSGEYSCKLHNLPK